MPGRASRRRRCASSARCSGCRPGTHPCLRLFSTSGCSSSGGTADRQQLAGAAVLERQRVLVALARDAQVVLDERDLVRQQRRGPVARPRRVAQHVGEPFSETLGGAGGSVSMRIRRARSRALNRKCGWTWACSARSSARIAASRSSTSRRSCGGALLLERQVLEPDAGLAQQGARPRSRASVAQLLARQRRVACRAPATRSRPGARARARAQPRPSARTSSRSSAPSSSRPTSSSAMRSACGSRP